MAGLRGGQVRDVSHILLVREVYRDGSWDGEKDWSSLES